VRECYGVETFLELSDMTRGSQISPQLLAKLERLYIAGDVTLQQLSKFSGVGLSTLKRHASSRDWFVKKKSRTLLIESEARNHLSEQLLQQAGGLLEAAPHCIPMKAEKHYILLIKLLELQARMKLKQSTAVEESPQPDNVIPLRQTRRPSTTRLGRSHL
jgi:hypothetical protein